MTKEIIILMCLLGLTPTQAIAADSMPAEAVVSTQKQSIDYFNVYSAIALQASELGGATENNLRYSVLSQIVGLNLDGEDIALALEKIRVVAYKKDDSVTVAIIDDLLDEYGDENSDVAAILTGLKGLPPIPSPPSTTYRNTSSSDY